MCYYQELPVHKSLNQHIRKYWILDNLLSSSSSKPKYALPNTSPTLAFISGAGIKTEVAGQTHLLTPGIYLCGQITERLEITLMPHSKAIMVQLASWSAALFTDFSLSELANNLIGLKELNRDFYRALNVGDFTDQEAVVTNFQKAFENTMYATHGIELVRSLFELMISSPLYHPLTVSSLVKKSGYSGRYVEKKFNQYIGLSVKNLHNILRIRSIVNMFDQSQYSSLGEVAHHFGYYDQSHFIKAYRRIMITAPGEFEKAAYLMPSITDSSFFYN